MQAALHLGGALLVAVGMAWLVLPFNALKLLTQAHAEIPALLRVSSAAVLVHLGLAACVWALLVIMFKLWRRPAPLAIHILSPRGSVMTETLIVLPLFLFMTFGMAQLALNNIAGILANVAVYQSARAAWLWQPEIGVTRVDTAVSEGEATNRARIAAALVMTPVAPGEFLNTIPSDEAFKKTRLAMATAQSPLAIAVGGEELLNLYGVPELQTAFSGKLSLSRALDTSSFIRRSLLKFAHAYSATEVEITTEQEDGKDWIGVKLTYHFHQVMPVVDRIFGTLKIEGYDLRSGYYMDYTRQYRFRAQAYAPNEKLPDGTFTGEAAENDQGSIEDRDFENEGPPP